MSTISASTTSTTAYVVTADTTGALVLQTGATPTTAVTIDTSQNVGIGTTPSAWGGSAVQLQLKTNFGFRSDASSAQIINNAYYDGSGWKYTGTGVSFIQEFGGGVSGNLVWYTAPSGTVGNAVTYTERMRLDSSGNATFNTSSVSQAQTYKFYGYGSGILGTDLQLHNQGGNAEDSTRISMYDSGSIRTALDFRVLAGGNGYLTYSSGSGTVAEKFRVDQLGNFRVGVGTSTVNLYMDVNHATGSSNGASFFVARYNGTQIGDISQATTSTVAYNTSSDYRLKENIQPMTSALEKVALLKPCTYTWKTDGASGQGFIAHELQEVVPDCVTGAKDAIETYTDEDGNEQTRPKYQGVDTSFLVATLTAAIQELKAELDALKEKVGA
jgi:hypothetical protein